MFQQPSTGGDVFKPAEHLGRLVVIWARSYREGINTSFGTANAVAADIHVIDAPGGPKVYTNALLFARALVASLREAVGGAPVLARIGQGVAKPGQSAPYILLPYTPEDAAVATQYVNSLPQAQFQNPAQSQGQVPAAQANPALAPAAQTAPAAPTTQAAPAAGIDPNNLPPEVAALLAQLGR